MMDFMAIVSCGAYPTPTPTDAQRASYAVSYGLLGSVPASLVRTVSKWLRLRLRLKQ